MSNIVITTESGADLPKNLADKYCIYTVPMHVLLDGVTYLDGEVTIQETLDYYYRTKMVPATSATSSHEYELFFKKVQQQHPNCTIIHIGYTSKHSLSFQNAYQASKNVDHVYVIDALNTSGGLTAIVVYAAQQLEKDPSIEPLKLIEKIEAILPKIKLTFIARNLEFLKEGGSVSNLSDIDLLTFNSWPYAELKDGYIVITKNFHGDLREVVQKFLQEYFTRYDLCKNQLYLIYSIGLSESVKSFVNYYIQEQGFSNIIWMEAGAMISTHAGPGSLGIAGIER